eukprot:11661081-Alexandrium_andersonii.AAC.1
MPWVGDSSQASPELAPGSVSDKWGFVRGLSEAAPPPEPQAHGLLQARASAKADGWGAGEGATRRSGDGFAALAEGPC